MTDKQIQAWRKALAAAGFDPVKVAETIQRFNEAMRIFAEELAKALNFDHEQTARKKRRQRDRRMVVKRSNADNFRQYKAKETAWRTQKRTGARRREWRGPWTES